MEYKCPFLLKRWRSELISVKLSEEGLIGDPAPAVGVDALVLG